MGARFTIVLDTDDPQGLRDALAVATILNKNHGTFSDLNPSVKVKIGKIALIKLVRDVAKNVEEAKLSSSLRDCKLFVDARWQLLL